MSKPVSEPSGRNAAAATATAPNVSMTVGDSHVATVEFSNPPANYFDADLIAAIADACISAADEAARAIVLRSSGKVFCAGAEFGKSDDTKADPSQLYDTALRLFRQPLPMIVAIQGAAIGGGLGLALAGDFRIASTNAKFAVNFAQIGIHHGFGLSATLPRVVGQQAAMDLLYTGRRIDGNRAADIGLVDQICAPDDLAATATAYAASITASAPLAVRAIRRTLRQGLIDEVAAAVVHEAAEQRALFGTADFAEGVAAVSQRRPGRFEGR
jgi:2-(1,2-epoxy-1,2-dihydrophenyl)acetyl-CoA isomerase